MARFDPQKSPTPLQRRFRALRQFAASGGAGEAAQKRAQGNQAYQNFQDWQSRQKKPTPLQQHFGQVRAYRRSQNPSSGGAGGQTSPGGATGTGGPQLHGVDDYAPRPSGGYARPTNPKLNSNYTSQLGALDISGKEKRTPFTYANGDVMRGGATGTGMSYPEDSNMARTRFTSSSAPIAGKSVLPQTPVAPDVGGSPPSGSMPGTGSVPGSSPPPAPPTSPGYAGRYTPGMFGSYTRPTTTPYQNRYGAQTNQLLGNLTSPNQWRPSVQDPGFYASDLSNPGLYRNASAEARGVYRWAKEQTPDLSSFTNQIEGVQDSPTEYVGGMQARAQAGREKYNNVIYGPTPYDDNIAGLEERLTKETDPDARSEIMDELSLQRRNQQLVYTDRRAQLGPYNEMAGQFNLKATTGAVPSYGGNLGRTYTGEEIARFHLPGTDPYLAEHGVYDKRPPVTSSPSYYGKQAPGNYPNVWRGPYYQNALANSDTRKVFNYFI